VTTGPGTGRVSTSETVRGLLAALQRAERAPSVGITEERIGSIVVPLLRLDLPRCDEYPTTEAAFTAALDFHTRFRIYRDAPADNLVAALASSNSEKGSK